VRKPMGRIIIVLCYLGMAALFFDEAMSKNKHWGFWAAGIASAIGILFFLDLVWSSTTFAMDLLEQRSFHGSVRRLRYADIEKAELVDFGKGVALRLLSIDGTKINVSGNRDEVIKAKELLFSCLQKMGFNGLNSFRDLSAKLWRFIIEPLPLDTISKGTNTQPSADRKTNFFRTGRSRPRVEPAATSAELPY
jgi:hypothetical protein